MNLLSLFFNSYSLGYIFFTLPLGLLDFNLQGSVFIFLINQALSNHLFFSFNLKLFIVNSLQVLLFVFQLVRKKLNLMICTSLSLKFDRIYSTNDLIYELLEAITDHRKMFMSHVLRILWNLCLLCLNYLNLLGEFNWFLPEGFVLSFVEVTLLAHSFYSFHQIAFTKFCKSFISLFHYSFLNLLSFS